ncbi:FUSC family protein [Sphaerisporangium fuscum]|uniref:FUSC family protein n=1 Tax=Sphaerisporangium fuscum TaxID=2835868 RepID=UPI001BDBB541|nr:FUSC family protein [Sphaerisporangium fuscum]
MTSLGLSRRLPLPGRPAVLEGLRSFVVALGTFLTLAALVRWGHGSLGVIVVGVVIAFSLDRVGKGQEWRSLLVRLPLVTICVTAVGTVIHASPWAGSALFVVLVFVSIQLRRHGPRAAAIGRLMVLPLLGMFVSPVPVAADPLHSLLWALPACLVALAWNRIVALSFTRRRPALPGASSTAAPEPGAAAEPGAASEPGAVAGPGAVPGPGGVTEPGAVGEHGVVPGPGVPLEPAPVPERGAAPPSAASGAVHTRLAAQAAMATALAFVAGHLLFPGRWAWPVITVLVITIGARSRGHVLYKGLQRFAGALAGATTATLIAGPVQGHPVVSGVVIFAYLLAGLILRQVNYSYWSFCVTSMLAVLYGLTGQAGPEFLGERLLGILLGAVCAIVPAFVLMPVRTEAVVRRNLSRVLEALGDVLRDPGEEARREFDQRSAALWVAAEPMMALRRSRRAAAFLLRRPAPRHELAECVDAVLTCAEPLTTLTAEPRATLTAEPPTTLTAEPPTTLTAEHPTTLTAEPGETAAACSDHERHAQASSARAAHGALRRNIATIRLTLGRRPAPEWVPVDVPPGPHPHARALAGLDAALRSVATTLKIPG